MRLTTVCPFNDAAAEPAADRHVPSFGRVRRLQSTQVVAGALGLLLCAPATTFSLELGEASIKSGLGQSLRVEIPYRLAPDERLTPECVGLVPASRTADALPTYTRVSRISISPTHIEIFDDNRVREPLIGLNVAVNCNTAPHFARSYQLFVDPPAILSNDTRVAAAREQPAIDAAAPVAARLPDAPSRVGNGAAAVAATSDATASAPIARTARATASPRARGQAGGNLTQGQTYRVVRGDTLSGIAARIADRPATIRQASEAIFAANANAFTRGNPDRIEEGRSITIPIMTPVTTALSAPSAPTALPVVRAAELPAAAPVQTVAAAAAPPSTAQTPDQNDAASAVAPDAVQPLPAAAAVVQPSAAPLPAAARTDVASAAPSPAPTGHTSTWWTALLGLGVVVALSAPLAFVRRRKQQAAAQARAAVQKPRPRRPALVIAGIEVVEGSLPDAPPAPRTASTKSSKAADAAAVLPAGLEDLALTIGPTDSVDLDVGAPIVMNERVDWFADGADTPANDDAAVGDATIEENAAAAQMPDFDTAVFASELLPEAEPDRSDRRLDDDEMTMTIVELDMLRQDYEAEHTLTQQTSQALRDAVADLNATKAARDAAAETSTMEMPQQSQTEAADETASSPTARVRMK